MAGGSQVTVTFAENQLTGIRVDKSTLNNLVKNRKVILASGGNVIMTVGAHDSLLSSAVNNSGIVEAQTINNRKGSIILLGGMEAGTTTVSGTLDASAPHVGKGGSIETSGGHVNITPKARITTKSKSNHGDGTWIIDPQDYNIADSGGDITGSQVSNLLASNHIIIASTQGKIEGTGNLNVSDAISWGNATTLTLKAVNNVNFKRNGSVTNTAGGTLNVRADSAASGKGTIVMEGGTINISGKGGTINFYYNPSTLGSPSNFSNVTADSGAIFTTYMLINTPTELSAIANKNYQNYALGTNINLSLISDFVPINFYGQFDGQNNTISNLTITGNKNNVGLFNTIQSSAVVKNLILSNVNISGGSIVGSLAGTNFGTVNNITVSGSVLGSGNRIGGLFGDTKGESSGNYIISSVNVLGRNGGFTGGLIGDISNGTYSNVTVTGNVTSEKHNYNIGGIAGLNNGTIRNASYTGELTSPECGTVGGFVGYNHPGGVIQGGYTTASINTGDYGFDNNGGFVGINDGTIDSSYSTGNVTIAKDGTRAHLLVVTEII